MFRIIFILINLIYYFQSVQTSPIYNRRSNYPTKQIEAPSEAITSSYLLRLDCSISANLLRYQSDDNLVVTQKGRQVALNLSLGENPKMYSCSGELPGNDSISISKSTNVTIYERARQLVDDVITNEEIGIKPNPFRGGEWLVVWDYEDRPEVDSIEITYMRKDVINSNVRLSVSVVFYRKDEKFHKKKYRIQDVNLDSSFGIRLIARNKLREIQHQLVVKTDRNLQKSNVTNDVISENTLPLDENNDVIDDVVEKHSPSAAYAIVPLVVFILILDLVSCITKKCGICHFIYMTTCGPTVLPEDQKNKDSDYDSDEEDEDNEEEEDEDEEDDEDEDEEKKKKKIVKKKTKKSQKKKQKKEEDEDQDQDEDQNEDQDDDQDEDQDQEGEEGEMKDQEEDQNEDKDDKEEGSAKKKKKSNQKKKKNKK